MKGTVLVRMPADLKAWVDAMAKEKNVSSPEYIRTLISREKDRMSRPKFNPFMKQQQEEKEVANV